MRVLGSGVCKHPLPTYPKCLNLLVNDDDDGCRDIIVSSIQLHYVKTFDSATPLPVELWPWVICSQVLQTTTIVSACVPYLREFLEAFPSGMLRPVGGGNGSGSGSGGGESAKRGYRLYFVRQRGEMREEGNE